MDRTYSPTEEEKQGDSLKAQRARMGDVGLINRDYVRLASPEQTRYVSHAGQGDWLLDWAKDEESGKWVGARWVDGEPTNSRVTAHMGHWGIEEYAYSIADVVSSENTTWTVDGDKATVEGFTPVSVYRGEFERIDGQWVMKNGRIDTSANIDAWEYSDIRAVDDGLLVPFVMDDYELSLDGEIRLRTRSTHSLIARMEAEAFEEMLLMPPTELVESVNIDEAAEAEESQVGE